MLKIILYFIGILILIMNAKLLFSIILILLGFKFFIWLLRKILKRPISLNNQLNSNLLQPSTDELNYYKNSIFIPSKNIYDKFIALDLETTGLDPLKDKIIEISLIKYENGEIIETKNSLINPNIKIPKRITEITGITNKMVSGKNTINDILDELMDFIGDSPLVAHNAMFDIKFLNSACKIYYKNKNYYIKNPIIDTLKLSRLMFKELPNHKLSTVLNHIGFLVEENHRSTSDALGAAQIYLKFCDLYSKKSMEQSVQFSKDELECYEIIKEILIKNNRTTDYLRYIRIGKYIVIQNFYSILRIKLKGNKQYVLTELNEEDLVNYVQDLVIEPAPKSETGNSRILINSPKDIYYIENLILQLFDKTQESIALYRKNVKNADKNIEKYLMSV